MNEIDIIMDFAAQYSCCAIDGVPIDIAKTISKEVPRSSDFIGLRFQDGVCVNYLSTSSYAKATAFEYLDCIISFPVLIENSKEIEPVTIDDLTKLI